MDHSLDFGGKKFQWFLGLLFVFVVLIVGIRMWMLSLLPPLEGKIKIPILSQKVDVYRDKWGVPHIKAGTELDALKALGFIMAQDRLFQMEVLRRVVNGELSEIFGKEALSADILLRKLRIKKAMEESIEHNRLTEEFEVRANAFLEGVHIYVKTMPRPIEFVILQYDPKPFTIAEMLAITGYMSLSFAEGITADGLYSDLLKDFSKEMVSSMIVRPRSKNPSLISGMEKLPIDQTSFQEKILDSLDVIHRFAGRFHGSNSWVLSPFRSQSGHALLANDPHIEFSNPGIWYEAHIDSPEYKIYGHFIPLIPFPIIGHDSLKAWALTMSEVDDMDLYVETFNPQNPKQVMFQKQWVDVHEYEEVIHVKSSVPVKTNVVLTPHGPLIDETDYGLKEKHLSLKWSYHLKENQIWKTLFEISRAQNWEEFKTALSHATAPGLNVSWVDSSGNIGWHVMGKIPIRPQGVSGAFALAADSGDNEYEGYIPFEENPHDFNPPSGVILSTNFYPPYESKYPLEGYWQPSERNLRLTELLSSKQKWTLEELMVVQTDTKVLSAKAFLPILVKVIEKRTDLMSSKIVTILKQWDFYASKNSLGATIYFQWIMNIAQLAWIDDMGKDRFKAYARVSDFWHFFKFFFFSPDHPWWDDRETRLNKESPEQIMMIAYEHTIKTLQKKIGNDPTQWRWGLVHQIVYKHFLGQVWPLDLFFNLGPFPSSGSFDTVNNMYQGRIDQNFAITLGPSTRRLIDMGQPDKSWGILPTGNVGQFMSRYYCDQAQMFLNHEYRFQLMDIDLVKNDRPRHLQLLPGNE